MFFQILMIIDQQQSRRLFVLMSSNMNLSILSSWSWYVQTITASCQISIILHFTTQHKKTCIISALDLLKWRPIFVELLLNYLKERIILLRILQIFYNFDEKNYSCQLNSQTNMGLFLILFILWRRWFIGVQFKYICRRSVKCTCIWLLVLAIFVT